MLDSWIWRVCRAFLILSLVSHPSQVLVKGKSVLPCWGRRSAEWENEYEVLLSWLEVYPKILGFSNRWNISLKWLTSLDIISYDTLIGFKFSESSYKYFTFMSCSRKYLFLQTPFQDSSVPLFTPMKSSGAVSFFILPGSSHCPLAGVSVTESDCSPQWEQSCHSCQCKNPTELWWPAELAWQMQMWGCCSVQHLPLAIFGHFWPFLAWTVMLAGDSPWCVTVCSDSSQPGSLMGLEGKQEIVNLQDQTVLSCHYQHFMSLEVDKQPGEKLKVKSWDLQISGFPSPLQILGFLTGWLWTGPQAKTPWAIRI